MTKIGLVLSGGGARAMAHIGVLKILEKANIKIDAIAGCSMGGIIGAFYAAGKTAAEIEEFFLKYKRYQFFDFTISRLGIKSANKFHKLMDEFIGLKRFGELNIPLYINATNISRGKEVVFSSGDLFNAIRASTAVPGIFAPLKIKNNYYIDGGVVNNAPVSILPQKIKKFIIVNVAAYGKMDSKKVPSLIALLKSSGALAVDLMIKLRIKEIPENNYILIKPNLRKHHMLQDRKYYREIIKKGERAARRKMPEIKRKLLIIKEKKKKIN